MTHRLLPASAALAASLFASLAHAQPAGVTIYGIMDAYVEHRDHMAASGGSRWLLNSGGLNTSRLGFRGTEDLGGGLKAVFQLESEVNLDSGQSGSAFWGRQANVGLEGGFGRVVAGRSYSTTYDFILPFDPMGYAPNYSWATSAGAAGGRKDGMLTGVSNMVKYRGRFGPVSIGGTVGAGEGSGPKVYALAIAGDLGPVDVALTWDQVKTPVAAGFDKTTGTHVAASYAVTDAIKLFGALRSYDKAYATAGALGSHDKSRTAWVGASYRVTPPLTLSLAWYKQDIRARRAAAGVDDPSLWVLRAHYALSKRTALYASIGHARADSGTVSVSRDDTAFADRQTGVTAGIQHRF